MPRLFFQRAISLNWALCMLINSRLIVLSTWWLIQNSLASKFWGEIVELLHEILLQISSNIFWLSPHWKSDVAIFWYKAIINSFGSQILNTRYPFISVSLILRPEYEFPVSFFLLIFFPPCTCSNLTQLNLLFITLRSSVGLAVCAGIQWYIDYTYMTPRGAFPCSYSLISWYQLSYLGLSTMNRSSTFLLGLSPCLVSIPFFTAAPGFLISMVAIFLMIRPCLDFRGIWSSESKSSAKRMC